MKRPSATNLRPREDIDYLADTLHKSNQPFLDDAGSPYMTNNNGHLSDSDSLSDSSKKIRKKRNTYQKISDDIRVMLLEAVQNGETLKAAAKRHKINYSSAKSILHTYRKEGRILKKSAQERTAKKKTEIISEEDTPQKPVKASKKENVQPTSTGSKTMQSVPLSAEKGKQHSHGFASESTPLACIQGLNDNASNIKSLKHDYHAEDNIHGKIGAEGQQPHNYHMSYYDAPSTGADQYQHHYQHHYQAEGPDYTSYVFPQREFDPFEMMNSGHSTGGLMYPKGFNGVNPADDKMGKSGENVINYEDGGDNCPLRGFMDTQNMFRQALRKASFFSYGGNSTGYRKDSMELF